LLERYVRYWQLSPRLDSAAPEDVQAFFTAFPDGPLTDRFRVECRGNEPPLAAVGLYDRNLWRCNALERVHRAR